MKQPDTKRRKRVLFVCVENSCRSQIAEGFANKMGKDVLEAASAGSKPSGQVDKTAIEVMKGHGVDLSQHRSKGLEELPEGAWDYVVTMGCGDACPLVPSREKFDWDIPNPKGLPLEKFREVVAQIEQEVVLLIHRIIQEDS